MDERKLNVLCEGNSCYLSSQNNKTGPGGATPQSPRYRLSREHTTRIHLAVRHYQHWAAVQISMSPFDVRKFPKQKFFQCSLRYTWCCETACEEGKFSEVCTALQQTYDVYYGPTRWDFSSMEYCVDTAAQYPIEATCTEKAQFALIHYIRLGDIHEDKNNSKYLELNTANDQTKRRRSDADDYREENSRNNQTDSGSIASLCKRPRLTKKDDLNHHISSDYNDTSDASGARFVNESADDNDANMNSQEFINDDGLVDSNDRINNDEGSNAFDKQPTTSANDDEVRIKDNEENAINIISKKILRGWTALKAQAKKERASCRRRIDPVTSEFQYEGDEAVEDRLLKLENFHWEQSQKMIEADQVTNMEGLIIDQDATVMSWKFSFIAGCLRKLCMRQDKVDGARRATIYRWVSAASIINSIVDGLWIKWGPKAVLVYEALAFCNYSMSCTRSIRNESLPNVIKRVVETLANCSDAPSSSLFPSVFHPALYISSALGVSGVGYLNMCRDLLLTNSTMLHPLASFQMRVSLSVLVLQWHKSLELQNSIEVGSQAREDGQQGSPSNQLGTSDTNLTESSADGTAQESAMGSERGTEDMAAISLLYLSVAGPLRNSQVLGNWDEALPFNDINQANASSNHTIDLNDIDWDDWDNAPTIPFHNNMDWNNALTIPFNHTVDLNDIDWDDWDNAPTIPFHNNTDWNNALAIPSNQTVDLNDLDDIDWDNAPTIPFHLSDLDDINPANAPNIPSNHDDIGWDDWHNALTILFDGTVHIPSNDTAPFED